VPGKRKNEKKTFEFEVLKAGAKEGKAEGVGSQQLRRCEEQLVIPTREKGWKSTLPRIFLKRREHHKKSYDGLRKSVHQWRKCPQPEKKSMPWRAGITSKAQKRKNRKGYHSRFVGEGLWGRKSHPP